MYNFKYVETPTKLIRIVLLTTLLLSSTLSTDILLASDIQDGQDVLYNYKVRGKSYSVINGKGYKERGIASWYGADFHDRLTASGELYDKNSIVAAHRNLPLHSIVEVKNLKNGKKIRVRVCDRGPFYDDRIIDLSEAAAKELDFFEDGLTEVEVKFIKIANIKQNFHKENKHLRNLNLISDNKMRSLKALHYKKMHEKRKGNQ
ncbi:septal ring lytic transglycosylase RlpA family protein [Anaplasmataceae bacterium AB001_6]|nr:septal ring lytic transglycosylase RlpA family protein [Anaplasmataceae bacterium AB001_6]